MSNPVRSPHLSQSSSCFLRRHADASILWRPWEPETLELARDARKPIWLSIGYLACRHCHRMSREAFSDPEVIEVLNDRYVCILVDREQRPDLDLLYQEAFRLLYGRGAGWPLNMVLTPDDRVPFFGATYVGAEGDDGLPGLAELLRRLADFFSAAEQQVRSQNAQLLPALQAGPPRQGRTGYNLHTGPLTEVVDRLGQAFDPDHGGFGGPPKFPQVPALERLMRHWRHTERAGEPDRKAGLMTRFTLEKMARGALRDPLDGGFYRYARDKAWQQPHDERMLADNATLLGLYAQAWRAFELPLFSRVAQDLSGWLLTVLRTPQADFHSTDTAGDAPSRGWQPATVEALLERDEYTALAARYGLHGVEAENQLWWPHEDRDPDWIARHAGLPRERIEPLLESARARLRAQRVRPDPDELQVIVADNALAVEALACAGRYLEAPALVDAAAATLDRLRAGYWNDGRLAAGSWGGEACLDGYAALLGAVLELLQSRWRAHDYRWALELAGVLLERFQDPRKKGGFHFTGTDHEPLIARLKPVRDDALSSGNGLAAYHLLRLGQLTGALEQLLAAERALKLAWPTLEREPARCCGLLRALEEYYFPSQVVVIRGPTGESSTDALEAWHQISACSYAPRRLTLAIPGAETVLPAALEDCQPGTTVTAYLCHRGKPSAPITDLDTFRQQLLNAEA